MIWVGVQTRARINIELEFDTTRRLSRFVYRNVDWRCANDDMSNEIIRGKWTLRGTDNCLSRYTQRHVWICQQRGTCIG